MHIKTFFIPVPNPGAAEDELNAFLSSNRISQLEKVFVQHNGAVGWSIVCTSVLQSPLGAAVQNLGAARKNSVDYKDVLQPAEFTVFDRLRRLRKELAQAEGLPPYAVFSNEQLAAFVQRRMTQREELAQVEGVGEARLARYGEPMLQVLRAEVPSLGAATAERPGTVGTPGSVPGLAAAASRASGGETVSPGAGA
jgi:superfamily II DNA helicase RecQ